MSLDHPYLEHPVSVQLGTALRVLNQAADDAEAQIRSTRLDEAVASAQLGAVRQVKELHWKNATAARGRFIESGRVKDAETALVNIDLGNELLLYLRREREYTFLRELSRALKELLRDAVDLVKSGAEAVWDAVPDSVKLVGLGLLILALYLAMRR